MRVLVLQYVRQKLTHQTLVLWVTVPAQKPVDQSRAAGINQYPIYPQNKSLMGEFLPNILKNKYSHIHDALQYVMVRLFAPDLRPDARDPVPMLLQQQRRDRYDPLEGTRRYNSLR